MCLLYGVKLDEYKMKFVYYGEAGQKEHVRIPRQEDMSKFDVLQMSGLSNGHAGLVQYR